MLCKLYVAGLLALLCLAENVDYDNQTHWEGYCETGMRQSPIDIRDDVTQTCGNAKFSPSFWDGMTTVDPITVQPSNLHSQFPSSVLSVVDMEGNLLQYLSAQYHIHVGSEHTINGVQSALELHLVHKLYGLFQNTNNYAVIGLLFDLDENPAANLFDQIDFTIQQRVNFKTLIGEMIRPYPVYHYQGSFTTPTCNQVVNWYVVQKRFPIRQAQLTAIATIINNHQHNSRHAQALNGRHIHLISPGCSTDMPIVTYNLVSPSLLVLFGKFLALVPALLLGLFLMW